MPRKTIQKHRDLSATINRGLCFYCQAPMGKHITADHLIPRSKGGRGVRANIVAACRACNKYKKDMTADEFFQSERLKIIKRLRGVGG